jgi:hypothetical protein
MLNSQQHKYKFGHEIGENLTIEGVACPLFEVTATPSTVQILLISFPKQPCVIAAPPAMKLGKVRPFSMAGSDEILQHSQHQAPS